MNVGNQNNGVTYGGASTNPFSSTVTQNNNPNGQGSTTAPVTPNQTTITPTQTQTQAVNQQGDITKLKQTFGQVDTKGRSQQQFDQRNQALANDMATA